MSNPDKVNEALRQAKLASQSLDTAKAENQSAINEHVSEDKVEAKSSVSPSVGATRETRTPAQSDVYQPLRKSDPLAQSLIAQFDSYVADVQPNRSQTVASSKANRTRLINLLTTTINLEDDGTFITVMTRFLEVIEQNPGGVFNFDSVYSGLSAQPGSDSHLDKVRFTIDLFLTFADPVGRAHAIKFYNVQQSAGLAKTSAARERLIAYITRISGAN